MVRNYLLVSLFVIISLIAKSDEGMWIPMLLGELNEAEMQAMGMRITAEDIYSENHSSLKDAVVLFGGGCTGSVISDEGLLITNHHCGQSSIQAHSSIEHDYLTNGYWTMDKSEELPNPKLKVTFLVRMEDVTGEALEGVNPEMNETDRYAKITENISKIKENAVKDTHYRAEVKPFFYGNRYLLFINEVFEDVRLVGAPPSNIGNFGGDTDNWMWPRHTGDFSLFRIYADSVNKPAKYSENNVPYKPKKHFAISTNGVKEGDFTFIFGYPGNTQEYITSFGINMQTNVINPARIDLRGKQIEIYNRAMDESREVRIQYTAKRSGIANGWKKAIGESRGITRLKTIEKKKAFEQEFVKWVNASDSNKQKYGSHLDEMAKLYAELTPLNFRYNYLRESLMSIEIIRFARSFENLVSLSKNKNSEMAEIFKMTDQLKKSAESHFRNYQTHVDKEVFIAMITEYFEDNGQQNIPLVIKDLNEKYNGNFSLMAEDIYSKSFFASKEKLLEILDNYKKSKYRMIEKYPSYKIAKVIIDYIDTGLLPGIVKKTDAIDSMMRIYMQAQIDMQPMKKFYPDANLTLRVAYGNVMGYNPGDAIKYNYYTTLQGMLTKENPEIYDYVVEDKLKELYNSSDYGNYADSDGSLHVCFTATNHTTGGNSGSPVLDADGNLIGLNFDRCWEGTMSDLVYDITQCRNIALDMRYCLFIIDKFAGAEHLIDEMTILDRKDDPEAVNMN
jgi:hypothetical protein